MDNLSAYERFMAECYRESAEEALQMANEWFPIAAETWPEWWD